MYRLRRSLGGLLCSILIGAGGLLAPPTVQAATLLTVGTDGTYVNIQDAIDAAVVGADTEIRIQGSADAYSENLEIPNSFTSGSLLLSGGWDSTFTIQSDDGESTIVDGGGSRVFDIAPAAAPSRFATSLSPEVQPHKVPGSTSRLPATPP